MNQLDCAALLFDLDGVLVDSHLVVERTWERWARRHGLPVEGLATRAHGRRSIETVQEVAPHLDTAGEVALLAHWEEEDMAGIEALPGARDILRALSGAPWAVVTSGGRELARRRLAHVGLPIPALLIAAEDVRVGKPAPDGYRQAAHVFGVSPSECVVIEDAPAGIRAGRAAGARVLALHTTFPASALGEADAITSNLAAVYMSRTGDGLRLTWEG